MFSPRLIALFSWCLLIQAPQIRAETWTVLVYWAVDNDLYEFSIPYLRQFEKVGSGPGLNLVVETDYPGTRKSERTLILKDDGSPGRPDQDLPHSLTLQTLRQETRSARPRTLARFLDWGMKHFPADRYALVIGSHGMNWRGIIEDGSREEVMSLEGLGSVLSGFARQRGAPLDLLTLDACRMSFGEVLDSLQGRARLMLASQFDVNGFDHASPLSELQASPDLGPEELGRRYVRHYPTRDAGEADFSATLLSLAPENIDRFHLDLDEVSRVILNLGAEEGVFLRNHLVHTRNEYHDLAVDFSHLIEVLMRTSPAIETRLEALLNRWTPGRIQVDSWGSLHLDRYSNQSPVVSTSVTAGSSPARGLSLTCSTETTRYADSPFGRRHPNWVAACAILAPARAQ
jgi:hypothetical protein